ncbi:hypothetical protein DSO57_1008133 [Entomophthora muscae]|uniref:Uncharacterized protein n=1 Tax=Entomophthora muscae TaxID=34485 RepID=A0ACC2SJV7_9FUNG|nr:hypothetical protein DSO57_1008133 [Entomophthora muscae]
MTAEFNTNSTPVLGEQSEVNQEKWREILKKKPTTVAAAVAAVVGVTAGYPFDTLKTRMQVSDPPRTLNQCYRDVVQSDGYLALWRGVLGPLCLVSFLRGMTFTTYDSSTRHLFQTFFPIAETKATQILSPPSDYKHVPFAYRLPFLMASGALAGSVTCLFSCPLELVKVQVQLQASRQKEGIFKCIHRILSESGPLGFYRGFQSHLLRDFFGTAVYFGGYETAKHNLVNSCGLSLSVASLVAGGLSGTLSWACVFPFDAIKSRLQRETFLPASKQLYGRSIVRCAQAIYDSAKTPSGRVNAFYRGLPPTLMRALPIHSLNFFVYEKTLAWVNSL